MTPKGDNRNSQVEGPMPMIPHARTISTTRNACPFAYQSRTTDFWQACDLIAGPAYWQQYGAPNDGKGEPGQSNAVGHGCSPTRFRQINVIQTD